MKWLRLTAIESQKDVPFYRRRWYVEIMVTPEVQESSRHEYSWLLHSVRRMVKTVNVATGLGVTAQDIMRYLMAEREDR